MITLRGLTFTEYTDDPITDALLFMYPQLDGIAHVRAFKVKTGRVLLCITTRIVDATQQEVYNEFIKS